MLSQNDAMTEFAQQDKIYQEAREARQELGAVLADYARDTEVEQKTVHLDNGQVKIDVEFKAKVEYDPTLMQDVANLLSGQFDDLFETVITFKPKARALKMFLSTKSTSEAVETAKKIIGDARKEIPQTPYVHMI